MTDTDSQRSKVRQRLGLLLGPAIAVLMLVSPVPVGMSVAAWRTAAVGCLMATWWVTEAIPIPATALLPLVLLPLLGIVPIATTAAPYANPVIFLFLGGFVIATALQRCGLHLRMALKIIGAVGVRPVNLIAGFMVATAFLSMWVSNTATVIMMLPMAVSIVELMEGRGAGNGLPRADFAVALLLGIAYASSIGGIGTLIGTPPNALLAGFASETYGIEIGFGRWMLVGVPVVVVALPLCWILLTRVVFQVPHDEIPGGADVLQNELLKLGALSRAEKTVGAITVCTAAAWLARPLLARVAPGVSDAGIAIAGAAALFVVPISWRRFEFAMEWRDAERLPWGVLVLFGGGLSLAGAIEHTGLAHYVGDALSGLGAWPFVLVAMAVTAVIVFLTELTSNTATTAAFLPVVSALAVSIGQSPLMLAIPAVMAASCAFMMPVATPPNAIVYASGRLTIPVMARAGILLNIVFVFLITAATFLLAVRVFG